MAVRMDDAGCLVPNITTRGYHRNVYLTLYLAIAIFSVALAGFLCLAYIFLRRFRQDCNITFVNQNITYIAQSVNIIMVYAYRPYATSQYMPLVTAVFLSSSTLSYVVSCISRYTKSFYVEKHDTWCMYPRSSLIVFTIWVIAAVIAIPPNVGWGTPVLELIPSCSTPALSYLVYAWIILYMIPIVIFSLCHYKLFRNFRDRLSKLKQKRKSVGAKFRSQHQKKERNSILLLALYDFMFFICYTPLVVKNFVNVIAELYFSSAVHYSINVVVLLNNLSSPFLQGFLNKELQREIRKVLARKKKANAKLLRHKAFYERNSPPTPFPFTVRQSTGRPNSNINGNFERRKINGNSCNTYYSTEHNLFTQEANSTDGLGIDERKRESMVQFDVPATKKTYKKYSYTPSPKVMCQVKDLSEELTEEEIDILSSVINYDDTNFNYQPIFHAIANHGYQRNKGQYNAYHPRRAVLPSSDSDYWQVDAPNQNGHNVVQRLASVQLDICPRMHRCKLSRQSSLQLFSKTNNFSKQLQRRSSL